MKIEFKLTMGRDYLYIDANTLRLEYKKITTMSKVKQGWFTKIQIKDTVYKIGLFHKAYDGAYRKMLTYPVIVNDEKAGYLRQMQLFASGAVKFGDYYYKVLVTCNDMSPHRTLWILNRRMALDKMLLDSKEISGLLGDSALSIEDVYMAGEEFGVKAVNKAEVIDGEEYEFERAMEFTQLDEESLRLKGRESAELSPELDIAEGQGNRNDVQDGEDDL